MIESERILTSNTMTRIRKSLDLAIPGNSAAANFGKFSSEL
jgi:hypothetical protein